MSRQYVQIANEIIRDPNLSSIDFVILVKLKQIQFYCKADRFIVSVKEQLRQELDIEDNRTVKKSLDNLFKQGYILQKAVVNNLSKTEIVLNKNVTSPSKNFTHIYLSLLSKIKSIGFNGIRLISYYESRTNRHRSSSSFCYASLETISEETGITKKTIIKYNEILVKEKLLGIEKHDLGTEYRYDGTDKLLFSKYNNHYTVRLDKIV